MPGTAIAVGATERDEGAATFSMVIEGTPTPSWVLASVAALHVSHRSGTPSMFGLKLHDPDGRAIAATTGVLRVGRQLTLSMGYVSGKNSVVFRGRVGAVGMESTTDEGPTVRVEGYDLLHPLTTAAQCRVFTGQDGAGIRDTEIVQRIARDHGLQAATGTPTSVRQRPRVQANVSDYAFLVELAMANDRDVFLDGQGRLAFLPLRDSNPTTQEFAWGQTLISYSARETQAADVSQVVVRGWDSLRGQDIVARAKTAGGSGREILIDDACVDGTDEAQRLADAVLAARRSGRVVVRCSFRGDPGVAVGQTIRLTKLGRFSASYVIREVTHRLSDDGFVTDVEAQADERGATRIRRIGDPGTWRPSTTRILNGVFPGVVSRTADPLNLGRVLVALTSFGDSVSLWSQLCLPGADAGRGLHVVPDAGAEVLVAFEQGDPARPYVLGSTWNQDAKPPVMEQADGKDRARPDVMLIRSHAGHEVRLDDTDGKCRVDVLDGDGNGVVVDMEKGAVQVTAKKEITLEAGDGTVTVKAKKIELSATDQLVLGGGPTGVSVKADGGPVEVRGKDITLN